MPATPLRLLLVEDSENDADLVLRELRRAGFVPVATRVETAEAMRAALRAEPWDLILADYNLPSFTGLEALDLYHESGLDIPFLVVSGTIGEELAVEAMRAGAHDYLLKGNLARLGPAITRELRETQLRRERRQDLDRLVTSEQRFTTIFHDSPVAILISDVVDGRVIDANAAALALSGYTRDEVIGHDTVELGVFANPEERRHLVRQALDRRPGNAFEHRTRNKRGESVTILISFSLLALDGQNRLLSIVQDITARKRAEDTLRESEERYRLLVENSHDLIAEVDARGTILFASSNHEAITGYTPAELMGTSFFAHLPPEELPTLQAKFAGDCQKCQYRYHVRPGAWHWFESSRRNFRTTAGEERVVIVTRDITETRRAEEARKNLEGQLHQAQKMEAIGTLAGGIAHDFNNILTGILGNVQLAEFDLASEHPARAYLSDALKACNRARDLVAQILTFSRRREQQRVVTRLGPVIKEALRLLRASLPATIDIRLDIDDDSPPVLCDPTQMHQVLMNLGANAAYAMREAGGVLAVSLRAVEVESAMIAQHPQLRTGRTVCLSVRDSGCGMDAATRERIFEPFFTTKAPGEGTGLGLAVVHGIVLNHEGVIGVDSQPGAGTVFHLYFPVIATAESKSTAEPGLLPRGRGERILLVDDEPAVVLIGGRMLARLGYRPLAFTSSTEALAAYRADPAGIDLVLTDSTMPDITGVELARQVYALRPGLPLVITSGHLRTDDVDQARQFGVHCFVEKPFSLSTLAETLHQALHPG
jgi:PAS domain S-box-containing protein